MFSLVVFGLASGALAAAGTLFARTFLPSQAFGSLPLLLTLLPAVMWMLGGSGSSPRWWSAFCLRRFVAAFAAAGAPLAMLGAFTLTGSAAMIGQEGAASFIPSAAWYTVFITLPMALLLAEARTLLTARDSNPAPGGPGGEAALEPQRRTGTLVISAVAAFAGCIAFADITDIRILFSVTALPALATLLPSVLRATRASERDARHEGMSAAPGRQQESGSDTAGSSPNTAGSSPNTAGPSPIAAGPSPKTTAATPQRSGRTKPTKGRRPVPQRTGAGVFANVFLADRPDPRWQGAAVWLGSLTLAVFIPMMALVLQRLMELGLAADDVAGIVLPMVLALLALPLMTKGWRNVERLRMFGAIGLGAAVSMGAASLRSSWWSAFYLANNGAGGDGPMVLALLQLVLMPALLTGSILAPLLWTGASARRIASPLFGQTHLLLAGAVFSGVLFALVAPSLVDAHVATAVFLGVLALAAAAGMLHRGLRMVISVGIGVLLLCGMIPPLTTPPPAFRHVMAPHGVREFLSTAQAGGRLSLFLSRDDDDPFQMLAWNDIHPLTSDPEAVSDATAMFGHLPMLLAGDGGAIADTHPRVLVLGSGSGAVLRALAYHAPASVDCVEPLPAVIALRDSLAHRYILPIPSNGITWHGERIPAFLARGGGRFDVIIAPEPLATPWSARQLLTVETFRGAADCLTPGGLFAQWLPAASLSRASLQSVVAGFLTVFPHAEAWLANIEQGNQMLCLIGSAKAPDGARARAAFDAMMGTEKGTFRMRSAGLWSFADLASRFVMSRASLARLAAGASPLTMYDAEAPLRGEDGERMVEEILARPDACPELPARAGDSLAIMARTYAQSRATLVRASSMLASGADSAASLILFDIVRRHPHNGEARRLLASALVMRAANMISAQRDAQALSLLNLSAGMHPLTPRLLHLSLIAAMRTGDAETAKLAIGGLRTLAPRHAAAADNRATIEATKGKIDDALFHYESAITMDQSNEEIYCNMAALQYQLHRSWEAVRILDNAGRQAYYPAKSWYMQGMIYAEQKRPDQARTSFEHYMRVAVPDDPRRQEVIRALSDLARLKQK